MAEKWGSKRRRSLVMLHPQSGSKGHKCLCSDSLPFSVWPRTPAHGKVPPTFTFLISIQSLTDKITVFLHGDYHVSKLKIKTNFHIRFDLWPLESCPSKVANLPRRWPTVSDWMVWKDNNWPVSLSQPSFTIFPKKWIQNANIKSGIKRSRLYTERKWIKQVIKKTKLPSALCISGWRVSTLPGSVEREVLRPALPASWYEHPHSGQETQWSGRVLSVEPSEALKLSRIQIVFLFLFILLLPWCFRQNDRQAIQSCTSSCPRPHCSSCHFEGLITKLLHRVTKD